VPISLPKQWAKRPVFDTIGFTNPAQSTCAKCGKTSFQYVDKTVPGLKRPLMVYPMRRLRCCSWSARCTKQVEQDARCTHLLVSPAETSM